MKKCSKCLLEKQTENFYKQSRAADGFNPWCKSCYKEYKVQTYDKERQYQTHKNWVANNQERRSKQNVAATIAWQKTVPEKVSHWKKDNKHRRRVIEDLGGIAQQEWLDLCEKYGNVCLACKKSTKLTMDHVKPVSKGGLHMIGNIQPLCGPCNSKKGVKEIDYRIS